MPSLTAEVGVPAGINPGLDGTRNSHMIPLLGNPRGNYNDDCQPVTNTKLKARMKTASVGPFRVTGYDLAVASLKDVMTDIKQEQPVVHAALDTAGMLCCRFVRGSNTSISNHSWGTAIDLTINGVLDKRGNDKTQFGLTLIAPIFNRHKWYWGAGFPTEDAMHFEVSLQLLTKWKDEGKLDSGAAVLQDDGVLNIGDRGPDVVKLQKALNALGESLEADGVFGPATRAAVVAFQGSKGLVPDGVAGPRTRQALGI